MPSIVKTTCPKVDITYHTYISHISQATKWTKICHLSLYSLPTLGVALVDLARMTNLISKHRSLYRIFSSRPKVKRSQNYRQAVSNLKGVT